MANKNFEVKHGLSVAGTERITAAGAGSLTNLTLSGNLTVNGSTVTLDTTTLQVADKNIVLNYHASNDTSSAVDGAGITIQDAIDGSTDATLNWSAANDRFVMSHGLQVTSGIVTAASHMQIAGNLDVVGQIGAYNNPGSAWGAMGFRATNYTFKNSGGTVKVAIDSSGKVGIGTSSPEGVLHVYGGDSGSSYTPDGADRLILENNDSIAIDIRTPASNQALIMFSDGTRSQGLIGYDHSDDSLRFSNYGNLERMRIISSGHVGIGTNSPYNADWGSSSRQLTVEGTNYAVLNLFSTSVPTKWSIGSGDDKLYFYDDKDTQHRMVIDHNGKVGIGNTSPSNNHANANMLVVGAGGAGGMALYNGANNGGYYFSRALANNTDAYDGGMSYNADRDLTFHTNAGVARMTIDGAGNVGIGTTSPAKLGLTGSSVGKVLELSGDDSQIRIVNSILHHDNSGFTKFTIRNNYGATSASATMELQAGSIYFCTGTAFTERLRINHLGRQAYSGSATANGHGNFVGEVGTGYKALAFERTVGGGEVGSIVANSGSTSYYTTSDYRLKENVDYTWDATARLKQLKPARFNFIADDTNTLVDGFLAHEVSSIVPEAIYGEKDGMADPILYEDGDEIPEGKSVGDVKTESVPEYQAIDNSKLVPLLVKTIQELEARLTAGGL